MIYLLANWIIFLPLAIALAIALAVSGDATERPQASWFRLTLRIMIWQMLGLALIGICVRTTPFHLFWMLAAVAASVCLLLLEFAVSRRTLSLVILATNGNLKSLHAVVHYLQVEGVGVWRRSGWRMRRGLDRTGDWHTAVLAAGVAGDPRTAMAFDIARRHGNLEWMRSELSSQTNETIGLSRMRAQLIAGSLSLLGIAFVGSFIDMSLMPTLLKISSEFGTQPSWYIDQWTSLSELRYFTVLIPLLVWAFLFMIAGLSWFPVLTCYQPLEWFFHRYYRALSLRGLAAIVAVEPQLVAACRSAATASPVPVWSRRLTRAAQRIENGEAAAVALQRSRLIGRRAAATVVLATTPTSLAWTLKAIAAADTETAVARISVVAQIMVVVLVLITGLFVGFASLAVFSTLTMWTNAQL